ncbi:ABC transporter ATP-binding protein [Pigmentiphaga aceris]|uniref:ABC transporter ATP-binding protein n=2 Tax=Pigmentiphaga aceris TaxID=1940612 RepID=A0A5C0B3A1_9BURK|nr:ABC transporter ATP-binding protein [Pigmentiphaga aceris]
MLQARHVARRFDRGVVALSDIDLTLHAGEILTLLGPSGCGKSSLLRLFAGLDAPSDGEILRDPSARLSFVFQEATLMPWTTVAANVALPLVLDNVPARDRAASVDDALARVGLSDFAKAYPRELSGGMKMRVSIARALVTQPSLLLMDEPFGALDDITRQRLDDELLALVRAQGLSVVFVTHNVFEAAYLSDRVAVMSPRPGRIVDEIRIDAPVRDAAFRQSAQYGALAMQLHTALLNASEATA